MTSFTIVDANDNPIGAKQRLDKQYDDIYRVSALWLTDSVSGDILLAQRKYTKNNDPGKWAAAVAGTVEPDETYESNITKEIEEEIGLLNISLSDGPKEFIDDGDNKFFCQWFVGSVDRSKVLIKIQEEEVESVKWVSVQWLLQDVKLNSQDYVPSMSNNLQVLCQA